MSINFRSSSLIGYVGSSSALEEEEDYSRKLKMILMRRLTWIVLVSYTLLIFKPVMPVIMDKLAHTFWEQQHILTVHEVNGKFHVHNELVKAAHQSEKDKQSNSKFEVDEYLPVTLNAFYVTQHFYLPKDTRGYYNCFYPLSIRDTDNPPPEA